MVEFLLKKKFLFWSKIVKLIKDVEKSKEMQLVLFVIVSDSKFSCFVLSFYGIKD